MKRICLQWGCELQEEVFLQGSVTRKLRYDQGDNEIPSTFRLAKTKVKARWIDERFTQRRSYLERKVAGLVS